MPNSPSSPGPDVTRACDAHGCNRTAVSAAWFNGCPGTHVHVCGPCTAHIREHNDVKTIVDLPEECLKLCTDRPDFTGPAPPLNRFP